MESILRRAETPLQAGSTRHLRFRIQTGQDRRVFVAAGHAHRRVIGLAPVLSREMDDYAPGSRGQEKNLPRARRPTGFAVDSALPQGLLQVSCNHLLTGYHRNLWEEFSAVGLGSRINNH